MSLCAFDFTLFFVYLLITLLQFMTTFKNKNQQGVTGEMVVVVSSR